MTNLEKEIPQLRQIFDGTRKGFAEFDNKFIKVDYQHILGIDLKFSRRGIPDIGGFHHDFMGAIEKSGALEFTNKIIGKNGFYQAHIFCKGNPIKQVTFFPAHWPREKVIGKIYEAYDNFVKSGLPAELTLGQKYRCVGKTVEGVEIEFFVTKSGKITTAYPKL